MDKRHSSSSSRPESPRPQNFRKRSNSFPISDALGCSTPEAELILAEGRAAVRSRLADRHRGRRRKEGTSLTPFNPKDHIAYLVRVSTAADETTNEISLSAPETKVARHTRIPSNATDRSTSTIIAPDQSSLDEPSYAPAAATSPLGDYSAQLTKFIQSQLNSIPTYSPHTSTSPRSCPDLSFPLRSPALLPGKSVSVKRHVGAPNLIEIPSVRPPERSAFSAWSSTDDEADDDEGLPLSEAEHPRSGSLVDTYTPSLLRYYEQPGDSTFLLTSTPLGDEDQLSTAKEFSFPTVSALPRTTAPPTIATQVEDYPASLLSRPSLMSSSSAPSFSSISTGSYFEDRASITHASGFQDGDLAAVTPPPSKLIPAISPFEGVALANVHDVLIQSQQRVLVDGMSFDMVQDFSMPSASVRSVQTPC